MLPKQNKLHILDDYASFSEQVNKLGEQKKKQEERLKQHSESLKSKATMAKDLATGAIKKITEAEQRLTTKVYTEATNLKLELGQKLESFIGQLKASPLKGSPSARNLPVAPVPEDVEKVWGQEMWKARNAAFPPLKRAVAALKAAATAVDSLMLTSEALETASRCYYSEADDEDHETFALPETAVADIALVLTKWGTTSAAIAECAWKLVAHGLSDFTEADERANELGKYSRCQFLRFADTGLQHMMKPANKASWADTIDDLCRGLSHLINSETMASEYLSQFPQSPTHLVEILRVHAKNPNIFPGAMATLAALFTNADKTANQPGNLYDLAALVVPQITLPLISIMDLCLGFVSGKKEGAKHNADVAAETLKLINVIINTSGTKGLGSLGATLLFAEDTGNKQLYSVALKCGYHPCCARVHSKYSGSSRVSLTPPPPRHTSRRRHSCVESEVQERRLLCGEPGYRR